MFGDGFLFVYDKSNILAAITNLAKKDASQEHCAIGIARIHNEDITACVSILESCFLDSFGCSCSKYSYTIPASPIIALFSLCQKSDTVPTIIHTHAPDLHSQGKVFFSEQDHCYFSKLSSIARNEWSLPFLFTIVTNGIYTKYCLYNTATSKANLWEEKL